MSKGITGRGHKWYFWAFVTIFICVQFIGICSLSKNLLNYTFMVCVFFCIFVIVLTCPIATRVYIYSRHVSHVLIVGYNISTPRYLLKSRDKTKTYAVDCLAYCDIPLT